MKAALVLALSLLLGGGLAPAPVAAADGPLAGRTIVLDPGHQLGNSNPRFAREIARTRFNGSITKPCNTTGTATNGGYPEATFNWDVARRLRRILEDQGARVVLTRTGNSYDHYGPCIWDRPAVAAKAGADVLVSIHADGAASSGRGFHVIAPARIGGWTDDIARPSRRLARDMIAGMASAGARPTTYLPGPLSVRSDQSTLNFSDVPAVIVELGNMRNRADAAQMRSAAGRSAYARQLAAGLERALR